LDARVENGRQPLGLDRLLVGRGDDARVSRDRDNGQLVVGSRTDLMTKSGHSSLRTLAKYARPRTEALARWQQETNRTRRARK